MCHLIVLIVWILVIIGESNLPTNCFQKGLYRYYCNNISGMIDGKANENNGNSAQELKILQEKVAKQKGLLKEVQQVQDRYGIRQPLNRKIR